MKEQDMENVKSYIDFKIVILNRKLLISFLFFLLMIGIPNIMLGKAESWTNKIYILFFIIVVVTICYFFINTIHKLEIHYLFHGIYALFISFSLFSLAFKIGGFVLDFTLFQRLLALGIYNIVLMIMIIEKLLKVKRGYYFNKEKPRTANSLFYASSVCGVFIGKLTIDSISQETMTVVMSILLIILSLIFAFGILSLLKVYLMVKLNNSFKYMKKG